jgi:hypothetical protein
MTKETSELVTRATNETIDDIVENQVVTYKRKGYGTFQLFTFIPKFSTKI